MAFLAPVAGIIGAVAGVAGTAVSFIGQQKQAAAVRRENRARQRARDLASRRAKRKAIRESLLAQANSAALFGSQTGGFGGSGFTGAQGGIGNTAARTLTNINQNDQIGNDINAAKTQQADAGSMIALGGGIKSLGGSIYNSRDALGRLSEFYTG